MSESRAESLPPKWLGNKGKVRSLKIFLSLFFMKHAGDCKLVEEPAFSSAADIGIGGIGALKQAR